MMHYVKVRVKTPKKTSLILKLNKINVNIKNIVYQKEFVYFEILSTDIKKVKKYLISYKLEILDHTGIYKLKNEIRKNMLFIVSIIFSICVFLILSNITVKVNVIHEDKEIRDLLYEALEENGVKKLTFKKSYDEYEAIILDIKNNYKDKIEWLEIDVDGMIVNVRVEERIINQYNKDYNNCHIIASKSGIIRSILTNRGVAEVRINDFVSSGDILINGMIKLNDEVKNNVCASGEVYAEVWYNVKASVPLVEENITKTGKMRYNFMIKTNSDKYVILKSRVNEKEIENKLLFKIFGVEFYIQKEYEVKTSLKNLTEDEVLAKAKNLVHEKLVVKGSEIDKIIEEKVLKKSINGDKLDIDMFVSIEEEIGTKKYYKEETDSGTNDKRDNGDNN